MITRSATRKRKTRGDAKDKEKEKEDDREKEVEGEGGEDGETAVSAMEPGDESVDFKVNAKDKPFDAALFGNTIQKGFAKLYNDPLLSDITLVVGKDKLFAHRMVLCAWSEIFRGMLSNDNWKESELKELPVRVEEKDEENFKLMLRYMYTGAVDFISNTNIVPLIRLSDYYGIIPLKEVCGELLGEHVDESNLFFLLDIVERYDCRKLNEKCGEFLAENFATMLEEDKERLLSLNPNTWAEMLKSDDLVIGSEEALYEAVLDFVESFDEEKKQAVLLQLLPHIRFPLIRPKYLVENIETNEDLQKLPIFHEILHETYRCKMYAGSTAKIICARPRFSYQRFDKQRCSSYITLSDDDMKASLNSSAGWQNVCCERPFSEQYSYIEWKMESGTNCMLGVVDGPVATTGYAGQYNNGWTYYSHGQIYHAGGTPYNGTRYQAGDTIGVKVDISEGKMEFYRNGQLSATVTGVPKSDALYPVACFSAQGDAVSIVPNAQPPQQGSTYTKNGTRRSARTARTARKTTTATPKKRGRKK
jgi:hypothetical protein